MSCLMENMARKPSVTSIKANLYFNIYSDFQYFFSIPKSGYYMNIGWSSSVFDLDLHIYFRANKTLADGNKEEEKVGIKGKKGSEF